MEAGGTFLIVGAIVASYAAWLINNWIRAKHGYELEDEWGGKSKKIDSAETQRLQSENNELREKIDAMQDRMIVLEKIVTDRGYSLSEEIEALRDKSSDSGIPLNLKSKEQA